MIDLPLDPAALTRFAWRHGHGGGRAPLDEDFGYGAHAWLAAALGEQAPRPFRLIENRTGLRLLGYASVGVDRLARRAKDYALPDAFSVCDWPAAASKEMPAVWTTGRHLGLQQIGVIAVVNAAHRHQLADVVEKGLRVMTHATRVVVKQMLELRQLIADLEQLVNLLLILDEGESDFCVAQDEKHFVSHRILIERQGYAAETLHRRHHHVHARPVFANDG